MAAKSTPYNTQMNVIQYYIPKERDGYELSVQPGLTDVLLIFRFLACVPLFKFHSSGTRWDYKKCVAAQIETNRQLTLKS